MRIVKSEAGVRFESFDYEDFPGEESRAVVKTRWEQFVVCGGDKNGIPIKTGEDSDHPFVGAVAKFKKSGEPFGYVESVKGHQKRINLAWAQKMAFNNKSIKSPIVLKGVSDLSTVIKQTQIGAVLTLTTSESVEALNVTPNVNLQAIEEGNVARQDMDFAAAATEEAMRGVSSPGDSGLKISVAQSAAMTPINKWVKAYRRGLLSLHRKMLRIIIDNYPPLRIRRIVGELIFQQAFKPTMDEQGNIVPSVNADAALYDLIIEDQAISDMQKQQGFNGALALHQSGFIMDAEYMIKNAPIPNPEEALLSHERAKADVVRQLLGVIQELQAQVGDLQKTQPKGKPSDQGARGKSQPQSGRQKMLGGTGPNTSVGVR